MNLMTLKILKILKNTMRNFINDIRIIFYIIFFKQDIKRIFYIENQKYTHNFEPILQNLSTESSYVFSTNKITLSSNLKYEILSLNHPVFIKLFFLTMDAKYLYTTTPDLNNSYFVSNLTKKTKYIYFQHSPVGLINAYKEKSFKDFNLVFCNNKYQENDIKKINKKFKTKIKTWKQKLHLRHQSTIYNKSKSILIAPTWSTNFFSKKIIKQILLLKREYNIILRLHYMSIKKKEIDLNFLSKNFKIDLDEVCDFTKYNILISDWSGIFIEYILSTKKKPILINIKSKNRARRRALVKSPEIILRKKYSIQVEPKKNNFLLKKIKTVINNPRLLKIKNFNELRKNFYL